MNLPLESLSKPPTPAEPESRFTAPSQLSLSRSTTGASRPCWQLLAALMLTLSITSKLWMISSTLNQIHFIGS
ncbi:hypothetical protein Sjap_005674 [Stephania japonica]|uniref:Uncharacterized protein n=1 Tax=Stephania japonica TaxID=461633 RepID=A0AAP0K4G3_9MAGN